MSGMTTAAEQTLTYMSHQASSSPVQLPLIVVMTSRACWQQGTQYLSNQSCHWWGKAQIHIPHISQSIRNQVCPGNTSRNGSRAVLDKCVFVHVNSNALSSEMHTHAQLPKSQAGGWVASGGGRAGFFLWLSLSFHFARPSLHVRICVFVCATPPGKVRFSQ